MEKVAAFSPMPNASVITAATVKSGLFANMRTLYLRSRIKSPITNTPRSRRLVFFG